MQFLFHHDAMPGELGLPKLLYVSTADELSTPPRSTHVHTGMIEMLVTTEGHGVFEIGGTTYDVVKNDLVIYNSGVVHNEVFGGNYVTHYCCAGTGFLLDGMEPNHIVPPSFPPVFHLGEHAKVFKDLFKIMLGEARLDNKRATTTCQALFIALIEMTLGVIDEYKMERSSSGFKNNRLGADIREYVNAHYLDDLTVQSIADYFKISPSYLSHTFKKVTGYSLIQYIIRRRIGEAQTLLITTDKSVAEIASSVGYAETSYFDALFKRNIGISPRKYRRIYRGIET